MSGRISKRSLRKMTPLQPWRTRLPDGKEPFVRVGFSFFECPEFLEVKKKHPKAALMYFEMLKEAEDKPTFKFTQSQALESLGIHKNSYTKFVKVLVDAGLIRVIENNANLRKPNVYGFVWDRNRER